MIKLFIKLFSISFKKGLLVSLLMARKILFYKVFKRISFIYSRIKYIGRWKMLHIKKTLNKKEFYPSFNDNIKFDLFLSVHKKNISSFEVMNLTLEFDEKVFFKEFEDLEIKMAVHRFVWIFDFLVNDISIENLTALKKYILIWIDNFDRLHKNVTHDPYSIGERISSWLFFYGFSHKYLNFSKKEKSILINSIKKQLTILSNNLEYQGEFTNNHILNNGKAFYLAGEFLNVKEWKVFGFDILKSEFNNFFLDGFFLENSTHYQMIYAKSFMEMSLVCDFGHDLKLKKWFKTKTKSILYHCRNLQSSRNSFESIPFFGDISPDLNPNWLIGYPFSKNKNKISKWYKLFKYETDVEQNTNKSDKIIKKTSQYIKIDHLGFEIWIWVKENGMGAHGHQDNGSTVVFHKGHPFVVDLGRFNYMDNEFTQSQIGVNGQFLPYSLKEQWDFEIDSPLFNNIYFKSTVSVDLISDSKLILIISNWNSLLVIKRVFLMLDDKLVIRDECVKGEAVFGSLNFPFKKQLINKKNNSLTFDNIELLITNNSSINKIDLSDAYYSPSYGVLEMGSKLTTCLNTKIVYTLKNK